MTYYLITISPNGLSQASIGMNVSMFNSRYQAAGKLEAKANSASNLKGFNTLNILGKVMTPSVLLRKTSHSESYFKELEGDEETRSWAIPTNNSVLGSYFQNCNYGEGGITKWNMLFTPQIKL